MDLLNTMPFNYDSMSDDQEQMMHFAFLQNFDSKKNTYLKNYFES